MTKLEAKENSLFSQAEFSQLSRMWLLLYCEALTLSVTCQGLELSLPVSH